MSFLFLKDILWNRSQQFHYDNLNRLDAKHIRRSLRTILPSLATGEKYGMREKIGYRNDSRLNAYLWKIRLNYSLVLNCCVLSVILSDPAPDPTMAFPDYQQSCADHARLKGPFFWNCQLVKEKRLMVPIGNKFGITGLIELTVVWISCSKTSLKVHRKWSIC